MGDENAHYWLVQRMAKATGVDLVAAMDGGRLDHVDWADIVTTCRTCQWADGCARWLSQPTDEERDCPRTCLNRTRFQVLQDGSDEVPTKG